MSGFQEKHFKIREAIRAKQIQEYKQKVRIKHAQEFSQVSQDLNERSHNYLRGQMKGRQVILIGQNIDENKNYLLGVGDGLNKLQERYLFLQNSKLGNLSSLTKGEYEQLDHLKEFICEKYEIFLNYWIQVQEMSKKIGEVDQKHVRIHIYILKIVSELSRIGVWVWKDEQRQCFSHFFDCFLLLLQNERNRSLLSFEEYIETIEISENYILNLLQKSKEIKQRQPNICHLFEFTQLDQLVIMKIFDHIFQIKEDVDYYMQVRFYIERRFTEGDLLERQICLGNKLKGLVFKLVKIEQMYLNEYLEEQSIRQSQCIQECPEIGNLTNGTVKSTLRLSLSTFFTQLLSISDGIDQVQNISLRKVQGIYEQIFDEVNMVIELLRQFCRALDCTTNDDFGEFEDSTSGDISETILGMMFALCQGVINSIGKVEQIEESSQQNYENKRDASELIFSLINHKDIVGCLTFFLGRRMYCQDVIYDLFSQSKISIYILTCIFNQQNQRGNEYKNNRQLRDYFSSECKKNELQIWHKNSVLQMQCLKVIEAFLKNYGIKVDEEDNLLLRYIKDSGDNNSSFYYEKLAGARGRMKI